MKVLIIRFSSIGDIVLTTPVIRCCKQQLKNAEIHYVTKTVFTPVLENNPYIDKLFTLKDDINEIAHLLKKENYDYIIDLHKNLRSKRLCVLLNKKTFSLKKLNVRKWLTVNLKNKSFLPDIHIVQRYLNAAKPLGICDDGKGLDYFLNEAETVNTLTISQNLKNGFTALVVGGSYYTKKIPINKLIEIANQSKVPIVLMGGKEDFEVAEQVVKETKNTFNTCGVFSLNQSASVIRQAELVISSDTGLMHIAAAFGKKIYSVWGNTIPEFGMSPYKPHPESKIIEVNDLSCRPCSKLGYGKCPKEHFNCMNQIDVKAINL